jgi:ABC-type transport system involved in multi-copper enzyme maturation permease subunit
MLPNEIERRTIYTILSKPVQRWQFLVGKYLGAVMALGLMMALMSVVIVIVFLIQKQMVELGEMGNLVKAPALYFVQMSLLAAVGIFFSTFVSPLVNFFLTGGIFLVGSLFSAVFETLSQNPSVPGLAKGAATAVNYLLPNFNYYNVQNPIINPGQVITNETTYYMQATVYGLFYIGILVVGGILVFDRREV